MAYIPKSALRKIAGYKRMKPLYPPKEEPDEPEEDVPPYVVTPFTDAEFEKFFGYKRGDAARALAERDRQEIGRRKMREGASKRAMTVMNRRAGAHRQYFADDFG